MARNRFSLHQERHDLAPRTSFHSRFISKLAGRFYINEQAVHVSNGLSTDLLCFPTDRLGETQSYHRKYLTDKIHHAIDFATGFFDVHELNALEHIAPHGNGYGPDHYVTMGLYLFLEDECSRLKKGKTFLTALREAGCSLDFTSEYEAVDLLHAAKKALGKLGMEESHGNILDAWFLSGAYMLQGQMHTGDGSAANLKGTYANFARRIFKRQEVMGLNLAISYALGNRQHMNSLTNPDGSAHQMTVAEMFERTKNLSDNELDKLILDGDRERERIIRQEISQNVPLPTPAQAGLYKAHQDEAKQILSYLPDSILALLCREGYTLAYSDDRDISRIWPAKDLPSIRIGGDTARENESARGSKALRQRRYNTIFLSNGIRKDPNDIKRDPQLKHRMIAESILHESMHVVMSYLNDAELEKLKAAVEAVGDVLRKPSAAHPHDDAVGQQTLGISDYFHEPLKTIDTNTLAQVLDYKSGLYPNYLRTHKNDEGRTVVDSDTRWEEVACNALGLMYAEYGRSERKPFAEMPELAALKNEIITVVEVALERSHEAHYRFRDNHSGRNLT